MEWDFLYVEVLGEQAKGKFIQNNFVNGSSEARFFEPIKESKDASHGKVRDLFFTF